MRQLLVGCLLVLLAGARAVAGEDPALDAPSRPLDYSEPKNWVCAPSAADCHDDLSAAVLRADGSIEIAPFLPNGAPLADCFYVYPTVSNSDGLIAEPRVTEAERRAVRQQVSRLSSVCRLFVPLYRQITYTSMKPGFQRPGPDAQAAAERLGDQDLLAAWDAYMRTDNGGRPFVLIGHSQGAIRLIQLIQKRIDGQPAQRQLLSAILPGAFVLTPQGKTTGGTFKAIAPCRDDKQIGCFIAFNALRAETVLPEDVKADFPDQDLVCTNPAALGGGRGVLQPYLSTTGETIIPDLTAKQLPWTQAALVIPTPFVMPMGLYSAECRVDEHGAFLVVSTELQPHDRRTGAMVGDWMVGDTPLAVMGLHLIDLNLVAGNLGEVIGAQLGRWRWGQ